jgi:hypothetical protein
VAPIVDTSESIVDAPTFSDIVVATPTGSSLAGQDGTATAGDSLGGGPIAVIVIVCLIVLAIVIFLVVWFAVQGRTKFELTEAISDATERCCPCVSGRSRSASDVPKTFDIGHTTHTPTVHNALLGGAVPPPAQQPTQPTAAVAPAPITPPSTIPSPVATAAPVLPTISPIRPPMLPLGYARAKYDFGGADETDLMFKTGDRVTILNKDLEEGEEWW